MYAKVCKSARFFCFYMMGHHVFTSKTLFQREHPKYGLVSYTVVVVTIIIIVELL